MSRWQAASLLQKAIRLGDVARTKIAVSSLLTSDPPRLWRRLAVIALEDVGLANLPLVGQVMIAARGKTFRRSLGGETRVALGLAADLASSPKNRAADDLLCILTEHPFTRMLAKKLNRMSERQMLNVVTGCPDLITRSYAAQKIAIDCNQALLPAKTRLLDACGVCPSVVWLTKEGSARTQTMLPLLVGLLTQHNQLRQPNPDDKFPEEVEIAGLPSWALDMFVRQGRCSPLGSRSPMCRISAGWPMSIAIASSCAKSCFAVRLSKPPEVSTGIPNEFAMRASIGAMPPASQSVQSRTGCPSCRSSLNRSASSRMSRRKPAVLAQLAGS